MQNPGREPTFCGLKALESLNGFESAVQLFVVALNEIRCFRAAIMKELLRFHITGEQIAVVEDMLKGSDLQWIVVVSRRSPADVPFEICLTEVGKVEDLPFEIFHKCSVGFVASHLERSSDVFEEVHMAELDYNPGVDCFRRHTDGFIVVADESKELIAGVLQFREELEQCLVVLAGSQHADRNVVREVINAVDEWNLAVVPFHRNEFPVYNEEATESLGIAVGQSDVIVVRKRIQLCDNASVGRIGSFSDVSRHRTNARALQMRQQHRLIGKTMVNAETRTAIFATISLESSPGTVALGIQAFA